MKQFFKRIFCSHNWNKLTDSQSLDYLSITQSLIYWNVWKCKSCRKVTIKLKSEIMYQAL